VWIAWKNSGRGPWPDYQNVLEGSDGCFALPGCDPGKPFTAWFYDPKNKLGATAELCVKKESADEPVTVRLQRCGSAVARFVDPNGNPLVNYHPFFSFVITPGAHMAATMFTGHDDKKELEGDWVNEPFWCFREPGYPRPVTDAQGRLTLQNLIPGATYRLTSANYLPNGQDFAANKGDPTLDFTAKSGQTIDLPDVIDVP
jgi:hypothetical protein